MSQVWVGRSLVVWLSCLAVAAVIVDTAAAQSSTSFGGVSRQGRGIGATAIAMNRTPDGRVLGRLGLGITCRRAIYTSVIVRVRGAVAEDGSFSATGSAVLTRPGRLRVTMTGTFSATAATGQIKVSTQRIKCEGYSSGFFARVPSAPAGAASPPAADSVLAGLTSQVVGGLPLSVALRVSTDGRKVVGVWQALLRCGPRGGSANVVNVSPFTSVRPDGSFTRRETFTLRFPHGEREHWRVTFSGQFLSDGAVGTLRARLQTRRPGRRYYPCDTGTQRWAAAPG